ncbi:hypothetical protein L2E82_04977 [Cichorium intybus]|uniref:Uncharacterized protein n=1 Tax=Cichorium intybus TaxID=13427 RepID=A0ACB9H6A9_CICIN|nr:hypothetical protein L2E82_04977 [Cichorium intybus]
MKWECYSQSIISKSKISNKACIGANALRSVSLLRRLKAKTNLKSRIERKNLKLKQLNSVLQIQTSNNVYDKNMNYTVYIIALDFKFPNP